MTKLNVATIEATAGVEVVPAPEGAGQLPAVAAVDQTYPILAMDPTRLGRIIKANIGSTKLTEFDVDRITVPTGGGKLWTVPGLEGESNQETIEGLIVYWKATRSYWRDSFDESGGGVRPDCESQDSVIGIGNPGGSCAACPLAQFGTHHKGRGQACKQMRVLFVIMPQNFLPVAISCPPTSLENMETFFLRLASRGLMYNHMVVSLALLPDKNKDGIKYSAVVPSMVRMLNEYEIEQVERYCEAIEPSLSRVRVAPGAQEFAG